MSGVRVESRRRRANIHFYAAILCMPPILLVCLAAAAPFYARTGGDLWRYVGYGALLIGVTLVVGVGYALAKGYRLEKNTGIPTKVGVATAFFGGLVPANLLAYSVGHPKLIIAGVAVLVVVGAALPWWLLRSGQRALWEPIDDELIDSGEEVVVRGRPRGLTLSVGTRVVSVERPGLKGFDAFEDLRDLESVTATRFLNEERHDVTGNGDELTVKPGAALHLRFTRTTWFVPVDNAEDVLRLITRRRDDAVALAAELAAEPVEDDETVKLYARRDHLFTLSIDDSTITMSGDRLGELVCDYKYLDEIESVTVTTVDVEQRRDVTGDEDEVTVAAGEALLIKVDGDEWLFPVDDAEAAAALITSRAERYRATEAPESA